MSNGATGKKGSLSLVVVLEYLSIIRDMIKHENELINQRLGWMFTLQALLFGGMGFLWERGIPIIAIFGFVGITSCISIGYSLKRGINAIKELLTMARDYKKSQPKDTDFPPTIGSRSPAIDWLLPALLLPYVFGIAWLGIEIIYYIHYCQ